MPTIQELTDQRKKAVADSRAILDKADAEKRRLSGEEETQWQAYQAEIDALKKDIDQRVKQESAEKELGDSRGRQVDPERPSDGTPEDRSKHDPDRDLRLAMSHWALANSKRFELITPEHEAASKRLKLHPGSGEFSIKLGSDTERFERMQSFYRCRRPDVAANEVRALSTQVGGSLGFTIAPSAFNANIEAALLYYGPMVQVATPLRTDTQADYPFMTDNETTKTGAYSGENTAITTTETVTVAQVVFHAYKATTNAILVPFELLRDTAINLPAYLTRKLGERLGRFINTETTTGAIKCKGIVTAASAGVTAGSATAIAFDDIIGLEHSVDLAYRNMPGVGFMCHDNAALMMRKLKDGQGRYLWTDGTQAGQPDRLDGKPLYINNDMQTTSAGAFSSGNVSVIFGDLSRYHLRTVSEIRIAVTDQRYWEFDQTAFAAYMYFDGNLVDAGTHPVKKLTH